MLREKKKFKNDEVDMNYSELKELMQVENKINKKKKIDQKIKIITQKKKKKMKKNRKLI